MQGKPYNVSYKRITEERNISAGITAVEKEMLLIVGWMTHPKGYRAEVHQALKLDVEDIWQLEVMEAIPASISEMENREGTGQEGAANILMK